jgi:hypothetical protein
MRLIVVLLITILLSSCREGGILSDGGAVVDTTQSPVKRVRMHTSSIKPQITSDCGLVFLEQVSMSNELGYDADHSSRTYLLKVDKNGNQKSVLVEPDWKPGNMQSLDSVSLDKHMPVYHLYVGTDGYFYAYGVGISRDASNAKELVILKFDGDCNVIYSVCEVYSNVVNGKKQMSIPLPIDKGCPLEGGRFAVIFQPEFDFMTQDEEFPWFIKVYGPDGQVEKESKLEQIPDWTSATYYSCGDIIYAEFTDFMGSSVNVQSISSDGKFLNRQNLPSMLSSVVYTNKTTILSRYASHYVNVEGEDGTLTTTLEGEYFYADLSRSKDSISFTGYNSADTTIVLVGGASYDEDFLYGYCKRAFRGMSMSEYAYNEADAQGLIIKGDEMYTFAGTSSKVVLGVGYDQGNYTIYYDELIPGSGWCTFVTILQTDDLKTLEN